MYHFQNKKCMSSEVGEIFPIIEKRMWDSMADRKTKTSPFKDPA